MLLIGNYSPAAIYTFQSRYGHSLLLHVINALYVFLIHEAHFKVRYKRHLFYISGHIIGLIFFKGDQSPNSF